MNSSTSRALAAGVALLLPAAAAAQARHYPLESPEGLRLHNVAAVAATLEGRKGLRLTMS
jgi:hypothetical protein